MHVLAFENTPDNRRGGQERSFLEVTTGLVERGHSVSLIYRTPGNLLPKYKTLCSTTVRVFHPYHLTFQHIYSQLRSILHLAGKHLSHRWDVLYTNQFHDAPFACLLAKIIRRPLACHLRLPVSGYLSRQYRWALNQCDTLIPISRHTAKTYRKKGIDDKTMRVVYNGVDTTHFRPQPVDEYDGRRIVYLGRITPEKGLTTLLEAFHNLTACRDDVELRIVGGGTDIQDDDYASKLRSAAEEGPGTVVFVPHVQDVRPILSAADLLVLPSEWGEPFGRVLIEAMACGIPVIGTRDGGISEVLGSEFERHIVAPGAPSELAQAIGRTIDWRDEHPELGSVMRDYVKRRFSSDQTIDHVADLLTQVA